MQELRTETPKHIKLDNGHFIIMLKLVLKQILEKMREKTD
jgi:hypothetical protein